MFLNLVYPFLYYVKSHFLTTSVMFSNLIYLPSVDRAFGRLSPSEGQVFMMIPLNLSVAFDHKVWLTLVLI